MTTLNIFAYRNRKLTRFVICGATAESSFNPVPILKRVAAVFEGDVTDDNLSRLNATAVKAQELATLEVASTFFNFAGFVNYVAFSPVGEFSEALRTACRKSYLTWAEFNRGLLVQPASPLLLKSLLDRFRYLDDRGFEFLV